jgi:hypothetical protein
VLMPPIASWPSSTAAVSGKSESTRAILGGFGGVVHVLGARWSFRGKDAGSVRT